MRLEKQAAAQTDASHTRTDVAFPCWQEGSGSPETGPGVGSKQDFLLFHIPQDKPLSLQAVCLRTSNFWRGNIDVCIGNLRAHF